MTKILTLCSIVAILATSCSKKTEAPVPSLTGGYIGKYDTTAGKTSSSFYISILDDNRTCFITFNQDKLFGSLIIMNKTFNGKIYSEQGSPVYIENGVISSSSGIPNLKGTWRNADNTNIFGSFSVTRIPPVTALL